MRVGLWWTLLVFLISAFVLGACARSDSARKPDGTAGDPPLCNPAMLGIEDGSFGAGPAGASDSGAAFATGELVRKREGKCERVTLGLSNSASPVSVAPIRGEVSVMRSYGVVRVELPAGVTSVAEADSVFGGGLVAAAYVVHGRDGGFFLDLHLAQPAFVRLPTLPNPARVGIDLSPGGGAVPAPAPRANNVVVLEPRTGQASYPLTIRGYARTFESNVIARILVDGKEQAKTFGTAADWATTWGEFELTIPRGPIGQVDLFVGEDSAKDGTPTGVTIPLTLR